MNKEIMDFANDSANEAVKVLANGLEEPIKETGSFITTLIKMIKLPFLPIRRFILRKETAFKKLEKLYEMGLQEENCVKNDDLREVFDLLYINAKSRKNEIPPAFIDVLKQLSPVDVQLIKDGHYLEEYCPIIRIFTCKEVTEKDEAMHVAGMNDFWTSNYKIPIFSHYSLPIVDVQDIRLRSIAIYNLHRLGLINTDYIEKIIEPEGYKTLYDEVIKDELYTKNVEEAKEKEIHVCLTRGYTSPTEFGRLFYKVCC